MNTYTRTEISVGMFVLLGLAALAWLSVSLGGASIFAPERIGVDARFATVGDLREGAAVKLAGVKVGEVGSIRIDKYAAEVGLQIDTSLGVPEDTIASIRTEGLLGESYVALSPGGAEANLAEGGRISQTEPPVDLIELISKYAFGDVTEGGGDDLDDDLDLLD